MSKIDEVFMRKEQLHMLIFLNLQSILGLGGPQALLSSKQVNDNQREMHLYDGRILFVNLISI